MEEAGGRRKKGKMRGERDGGKWKEGREEIKKNGGKEFERIGEGWLEGRQKGKEEVEEHCYWPLSNGFSPSNLF